MKIKINQWLKRLRQIVAEVAKQQLKVVKPQVKAESILNLRFLQHIKVNICETVTKSTTVIYVAEQQLKAKISNILDDG